MRRERILLIISFFTCSFLQGQRFDPFKNTVNTAQKVQVSKSLWQKYLRTDIDSLKVLAIYIEQVEPASSNAELIYFGKRVLGCYWVRSGEVKLGKTQLKEALTYHRKLGDKANETEELNELGIASFMEGDYSSAKVFFESSLKAGKDSPNPTHYFLAELNLAKVFDKLNMKQKSIAIASHYLRESLKMKKNESASNAYGFLSDLALERKNLPLAKEYLDKSIHCLSQADNVFFRAQALTNMGAYCATIQDFVNAKNYFNQALALRIKVNHRKGILESYYNLGSLAYMQNDFKKAENIFILGLERAKSEAFISDQIDFLEMLVEIQKDTKNKDKEIEYYRLYLDLKDENQVKLLKSQEENALLVDFFDVKKSEALQLPVTNQFWTGILIGSGGMLLCLILFNLIFKNKETLLFTKRYDE